MTGKFREKMKRINKHTYIMMFNLKNNQRNRLKRTHLVGNNLKC